MLFYNARCLVQPALYIVLSPRYQLPAHSHLSVAAPHTLRGATTGSQPVGALPDCAAEPSSRCADSRSRTLQPGASSCLSVTVRSTPRIHFCVSNV